MPLQGFRTGSLPGRSSQPWVSKNLDKEEIIMPIANPYLERQIYSPQATAVRGIRSTVLTRYYLHPQGSQESGMAAAPATVPEVIKPGAQQAIYSPGSSVDWSGPPGEAFGAAGDMSQNAVASGLVSPQTADTIEGIVATALGFEKGEHGYQPTVTGLLGIPGLLTNPLGAAVSKGVLAIAKKGYDYIKGLVKGGGIGAPTGSSGNIGSGTNPATGLYGGYEGAMFGSNAQAPVSPLADMDFGGGGTGDSGDGGSLGGAPGAGSSGAPGADGGFGFGFGM
jgi:hypothetical protein